jgi:hypothetical protein
MSRLNMSNLAAYLDHFSLRWLESAASFAIHQCNSRAKSNMVTSSHRINTRKDSLSRFLSIFNLSSFCIPEASHPGTFQQSALPPVSFR